MGELNNLPINAFSDEYLIYLRKSRSDNQKETVEETLARHERDLQKLAVELTGDKIPEHNIFREVVSGGEELESRPEFLKVLKKLESGNIKGVLVIEPPRLSRSGMYGAGDVINAFYYTDTLICTPPRIYNLQHEFDKKFIEMELLKGADYLEYVKTILDRGKHSALSEGKFIGSIAPYGYDKEKIKDDKGYKLVINEEEAKVVKMIFKLYLEEDLGKKGIAMYLNKIGIKPRDGDDRTDYWEGNQISYLLSNPTYYGKLTWNKTVTIRVMENGKVVKKKKKNEKPILVKGMHEPIITKEEFEMAQEKMKSHPLAKLPIKKDLKNPLAGLIKCKHCKYTMIRRPYHDTRYKQFERVYEIDKQFMTTFLRNKKEEVGLTVPEIADKLNVSLHIALGWFRKNTANAHYSKVFSDNWFKLKDILKIETNEYDKLVTSYKKNKPVEFIGCFHRETGCKNVSSQLHIVENELIKALKGKLDDFNYFIDNYEEEITKANTSNLKAIEGIEKAKVKLNKRMKNAKEFYELGDYSREEYLESKYDIENELQKLDKQLEELNQSDEQEKLLVYKKRVPKLQHLIKEYPKLNIAQKNEILKTIIEKVEYSKTKKGIPLQNDKDNFTLEIFLKI